MASFRTIIILGGLLCMGLLWGGFLASRPELHRAGIDIEIFAWALSVGLSFLIVIRVWDAWYQHIGRDVRDKRQAGDPRDERDERRPSDPRDKPDTSAPPQPRRVR